MTLDRYLADAVDPLEERGRLADALHPEGFSTPDPAASGTWQPSAIAMAK
jgi:hypothetical protein